MAVVGDAYIIVRALTDKVEGDIRRGFSGVDKIGEKAGKDLATVFSDAFSNNKSNGDFFGNLASGLEAIAPEALNTRKAVQDLTASGNVFGTSVATLIGSVSALIGGLVALGGNAIGAAASLAAAGNVLASFGLGMVAAKIGLGGVGQAFTALNKIANGGGASYSARLAAVNRVQDAEANLAKTIEQNRNKLADANEAVRRAQIALNQAIIKGREEIQQLGFDAEGAALSEKKAALELDKARANLAAVQDLPPNSRVRKEAELAYQEAELNLRKAKDKSADLNKEQNRLAKTGVAGTAGVIEATQRLSDAEKARARDGVEALRSQAAAELELARAKAANDRVGSGSGGANPLAGLTAAQVTFVRFLQSINPKLKEIRQNISEAFLVPLQQAITLLVNRAFPTINAGMTKIAGAMGGVAVEIAKSVTSSQNLLALGKFFTSSSKLLRTFGGALGNIYGIALTLLNALAPTAQRFADWLKTTTGRWDTWMKSAQGSAAVTDFFTKSSDAAAKFGKVFGNIFKGIGAIISANLGPGTGGDYLLNWLVTATDGFGKLGDSANGKGNLKQYFNDVAVNSQKIFSSVGALIGQLVKLGADPTIGKTFDILKQGAPALGELLSKAQKAGPSLAGLVTSLIGIANKMADTGAIKIFFDTLKIAADTVRAFLDNPVVNAILTVTGRLFGIGVALNMLIKVSKFAFNFLIGDLIAYLKKISFVVSGIGDMAKAFGELQKAGSGVEGMLIKLADSNNKFVSTLGNAGIKAYDTWGKIGPSVGKMGTAIGGTFAGIGRSLGTFFTGPVGIALGVIALLVGAFILLYKTSDTFRAQMDAVFAQLMAVFAQAGQQIMAAIQPLIPVLMGAFTQIMNAVAPLIPILLNSLVPAFQSIVTALIPVVTMLLSSLVPVIGQVASAIIPLIGTIITALVPAIVAIVNAVVPVVVTLINILVPVFTTIINAMMPLITMIINMLVPVITQIATAFTPVITMIVQQVVPVFTQIMNTLMPLITMIINMLVPVISQIITAFMPVITMILQLLMPVLTVLINIFSGIITVVMNVVMALIKFLMPIITTVIGAFAGFIKFLPQIGTVFAGVWNGIVSFFKGIANWLIGLVEGMVNGMIDAINRFTKPFKDAIQAVVKFFGGNIQIGIIPHVSLPRLAKGGVVAPSPGGSLVNVAEAGRPERIEPLDANGMSKRDKAMLDAMRNSGASGIQINVHPAPGMNEQELAAKVGRELALQMRKGAI
jgi:phage-related protein